MTDLREVHVTRVVVQRTVDPVAAAEVDAGTCGHIDVSGLVTEDLIPTVSDLGTAQSSFGAVVVVFILVARRIENIDVRTIGNA